MNNLGRVFMVPGLVALVGLSAAAIGIPASAQDNHVPRYGEKDKDKTAAEITAAKEAEKAYQRSLGNIPAQKSTDPWGTVRSDDAPKAAAKTASPKPKAAKNDMKNDTKNDTKPDSVAKQ